MFSTRKESLTSPSLDDSFFPFSSSTPVARHRIMGAGVRENSLLASHTDHDSSSTMLEKDLILAAEVGQALLERNEELEAQLEQMRRDVEVRDSSVFPSLTNMKLLCKSGTRFLEFLFEFWNTVVFFKSAQSYAREEKDCPCLLFTAKVGMPCSMFFFFFVNLKKCLVTLVGGKWLVWIIRHDVTLIKLKISFHFLNEKHTFTGLC